MLAAFAPVLSKAQRGRYAVGSFNTANLELTQAIVTAAEAERAPAILSTTEKAIAYAGIEALSAMAAVLARRARVPIVLNLDHGKSLLTVQAALRAGYTGIMFDGSRLPYADNLRLTARAVALAERYDVTVEGELGSVGGREDVRRNRLQLTDPWQAQEFVRKTGIAALAVGIGSAHGLPVPGERLDFDRLKEIHERVRIPLVLHGASSTPPVRVRRAIRLGVVKINIDTDLRLAFTQAVRQTLSAQRSLYDPRDYLQMGRDAVVRVVRRRIRLFGSSQRA